MPDYGIEPADGGHGLLTWSWAVEQLNASVNFWVASTWPDGRAHLSAVWGVWLDDAVWFSCGLHSRKMRNLRADPRCSVAVDDSMNPVVVDGVATVVRDPAMIKRFVDALNVKYASEVTYDFLDPDTNASIRVDPKTVIAIRHDDFTGSPTRWTFPEASA